MNQTEWYIRTKATYKIYYYDIYDGNLQRYTIF